MQPRLRRRQLLSAAGFTMILRRRVENGCTQTDAHMASLLLKSLPAAWVR